MSRNLLDSIISYFNPLIGLRRDQARMQSLIVAKNSFDAAGTGRRNTFFGGSDSSANVEGRKLPILRGRSRELIRNLPYASKAIRVIVSNTIGTGIRAAAQSNNKKRKEIANDVFIKWADSIACDFDGRNNLYGLESLSVDSMAGSGEALIIRHISRKYITKENPIPLKIQVLEGDYLDQTKEGQLSGGKYIIQGVQFLENGEREGYWIFDQHPGERGFIKKYQSNFVRAERVIHLYEVNRPGQSRGIPWGVSGFTRLRGIDDFQDARIEQMKVAACLAGFIIDDSQTGSKGDLLPEKLEPGMLPKLGSGQDIRFNNPPSVSGQEGFVATEMHAVAASYGISYESLTGDYSQVNFSSGRMGWIEMHRNITRWQTQIVIPVMLKTIEKWFIDAASFSGVNLNDVTFKWTPPRREMIDPTKEIPAMIKAIRAGLKPWQETVRELGYDPSSFAKMIKEDIELFDKFKFILDIDPRKVTNGGQFQQQETEEDGEKE